MQEKYAAAIDFLRAAKALGATAVRMGDLEAHFGASVPNLPSIPNDAADELLVEMPADIKSALGLE